MTKCDFDICDGRNEYKPCPCCYREWGMPTSAVRTGTVEDAVIAAMKDHGSSLDGCTVFDENWKAVGVLSVAWPGPVVKIGRLQIRVKIRSRSRDFWPHAEYTPVST